MSMTLRSLKIHRLGSFLLKRGLEALAARIKNYVTSNSLLLLEDFVKIDAETDKNKASNFASDAEIYEKKEPVLYTS